MQIEKYEWLIQVKLFIFSKGYWFENSDLNTAGDETNWS